MDILKKFLKWLLHVYISLVFINKSVYVITGLRRSGNHAFINWFANALENKNTTFESIVYHVEKSSTNKILFINEVNYLGVFRFIQRIRSLKDQIKTSSFIIISLEDYIPENSDKYIPKNAKKIAISRSTLNLIASRLQRAINEARLGKDRGDMTIDEHFFDMIAWLNQSENHGWIKWHYDSWIKNDSDYRKNFLSKFGLTYDSNPTISAHGNGSSFTGQNCVPKTNEVMNRWKNVDWPERILNLINDRFDEGIINIEEMDFIKSELTKITKKP